MSDAVLTPASTGAVVTGERPTAQIATGKPQGHMGVTELCFTVLAFSAPVVVVSSFIPFVILFNDKGAPANYLAATFLLMLFAVGYATMARYLPNPGAFYAFITAGLGRVTGLGAAFTALLGYVLMTMGVYAYFGIAANQLVHGTLGGPEIAWYWYALVSWLGCGVLGYLNIEFSAKVLSIAMVCEIAIVLVYDVAVYINGGPEGRHLAPLGWHAFTSGTVGVAVLFAVTCFLGFEATAIFRDEVKRPTKTIPRATYLAVFLIGIFYTIAAWALVTAYGPSHVGAAAAKDPAGIFPASMLQFVGTAGHDIVAVLIVTSSFACLLSVQNIMSRYGYCLGSDGAFPRRLSRVHRRFHSPYAASVAVSAAIFFFLLPFVFIGSSPDLLYGRLAGTGGFCILVLMTLTSVSVVTFFRRSGHGKEAGPWRSVVAPIAAATGMGVTVYLAIAHFTTVTGASTTLAVLLQGLVWSVFAVGMLLALYFRRVKPDVYRCIGRQKI
jgi:amino acid transporter